MANVMLQAERGTRDGRVTVLLASAATDKRRRWGQRLRSAFAILEVSDRTALERTMRDLEPRVLLLDLGLPGLGGVSEISRLQGMSARTKIIALGPRADDQSGLDALQEGARGYDSCDIEPSLLTKAVNKVHAGEIWIRRRVVTAMLTALKSTKESSRRATAAPSSRLNGLTRREHEVAALIAEGACNKDIARQLNITERTVKAHLSELFRDLQVSDRLQLAVLLNREGLPSRSD